MNAGRDMGADEDGGGGMAGAPGTRPAPTSGAATGLGVDGWTLGAGVRLHHVSVGDGPLVVLLHGFPDFWYGWRHQLAALAAAGFRVVAPDLRGYNLSDRPPHVADYGLDHLADDVAALVRGLGAQRAHVVGHDWGGVVAWHLAARHPDVVDRLAILNAPHPARFRRLVRRPAQALRSTYVAAFQLPFLPELALTVGHRALLRHTLRRLHRPGALDAVDLDRYVAAFPTRHAMWAALAYYRALVRNPPERPPRAQIPHETLVLWGDDDPALARANADGLERWVPRVRARRVPDAGHFVMADAPAAVNDELTRFFAASPAQPF